MTEEINDTLPKENENENENEIVNEINVQPLEVALSIGELLRSKREEKGLNLKTISQQTKIHMGLLEHLENNELCPWFC
jgi:ribosome-binding protein aMBF1 (putative translation factor)